MDDFSDDSDVNPEEMARMVQDFDDLDNDLLGGSSKKRDIFSIANNKDTNAQVKKKVAFKNAFDSKFNDDDPLADPLSEVDDSYETKKSNLASAKSNLVADLFGLKNPKTVEKSFEPLKAPSTTEVQKIEHPRDRITWEDINLPFKKDAQKPPDLESSTTAPTLQNARNQSRENLVQTAKVDPPKLPSTKARKLSLMEDLLGTGSRSAAPKEIDARLSFSKIGLENPATSLVSEPQKSDQPVQRSSGYGFDISTPREPRRGRRNSAIISDPLGLFAAPTKQLGPPVNFADLGSKSNALLDDKKISQADLPEWLGGATKLKPTNSENENQSGLLCSEATSEVPPTVISSATSLSNPQEPLGNLVANGLLSQTNQQSSVSYPDMSMLIGSQFDQQAAMIAMQQQENELRTATTLSRQNDQVSKIVESQRAKLDEQEKMFNLLIKRQIERQSMLETQMKIQQARIDHYVQTLMSQPTSMPTVPFLKGNTASEVKDEGKMESPECLVKQLQLENVCLENTLAILKEKQEKEITIMEASYEKQMAFMRESMDKLEKRMQQDSEALEIDYEKKLEKLKEEKSEVEQTYREEIDRLKKNEKLFMKEIHARHSYNVELLQKEHADTIDAISRAKELERKAVDSITTNKTDLGDLFNRSQLVIESFQNLQKKIEDKEEQFDETRGSYLRKQEENLQLLRDQLNMQQEALADERKRLVEISLRLDTATSELTTEFKKKSSTINETEDKLATRERAHLREKQLTDEQINWERQNLRVMKDAWMQEQERQIKLLSEEREAAAIERSKLEVLNRLKSDSNGMAKVELESALKTAQQAANEAMQERRKWQEKSRALEEQRRFLQEKEKNLVYRAKELEDLTQSTLIKREEGFQALKEAQLIEQQHKERLGQLQMQLESLAERESKIATEKLALARERLATRFEQAEKSEKDIVETAPTMHHDRSFLSNSHVSTHFRDIVDPHLLLLKLNLDNKLDASNELISAMQVISQ